MKKDAKYLYLLTLLYFTVSFIGIWHHELWLDEAHHWLLARDSGSIAELYHNTRLEGHPLTWSILLYGLTRLTTNPFWMQVLHILISTSTVFVFLRKAPFSYLFKGLFIFGYFMLFEYNLISRNYALGVLLLFLACALFQKRQRHFVLLCFFLAFAANIHLIFSVVAFALFLTLLLDNWQHRKLVKFDFLMGYLVFGIGLVLIILQIRHTDSQWLLDPINQLPIRERLVIGFGSFFKGLVNIPDFRTIHFWNSNLIVNWNRNLSAVLALLAYGIPLLLFFKSRKTLFFVYSALIGVAIFFFVTQRPAIRFHGINFVIVFMALWIEHYYETENYKLKDFMKLQRLTIFRMPIVYSILFIQFCSGIYAYAMDYEYPFTAAKETVNYLKEKGLSDREIVTVSCDGTLLSAYLERKIWFLCNGSYQGFCHWNDGCVGLVRRENSVAMLADFMNTHDHAIFVSYYALSDDLHPNVWVRLNNKVQFRFLKKFDNSIVEKTNYYLFEIAKIKS